MNGHLPGPADRRVPIALGVLAAVLALLGVQQMTLPGAGPAEDQSVELASTTASSPSH